MRPHACIAALLAPACLLGGCYRHVVGASGPGSERYDVQEANIKQGESMWSQPDPQEREPDRYGGTALQRAKPIPSQRPKTQGQQDG